MKTVIGLLLVALVSGIGGVARAAEREVSIDGGRAPLYGTLETPEAGARPRPVVLILAGSGPTDRDGNSALGVAPNELRQLADALAEASIASLRIDKRGVGKSAAAMPPEEELRLSTYVDDAVAWSKWLSAQTGMGCVFIAGHSEGAVIAVLAAQRVKLCGVVSLEGPGRPLAANLREQLDRALTEPMRTKADTILAQLESGRPVADVDPALSANFRPSIQPYLISEFTLDPAAEAGKLKTPLLLVQGTSDVKVTTADLDLLAAARPDARKLIVTGMIHPLKVVTPGMARPAGGLAGVPLAPEVATGVIAFVREHAGG